MARFETKKSAHWQERFVALLPVFRKLKARGEGRGRAGMSPFDSSQLRHLVPEDL